MHFGESRTCMGPSFGWVLLYLLSLSGAASSADTPTYGSWCRALIARANATEPAVVR